MGFGVIPAQQFVNAKLYRVTATDHGDIVGKFGAAQNGEVRQEDVGP